MMKAGGEVFGEAPKTAGEGARAPLLLQAGLAASPANAQRLRFGNHCCQPVLFGSLPKSSSQA